MSRPLSELNVNIGGGSQCFIRTERNSTNSTLSKINNLFPKNLVYTEDLDLEIMRMSPDHPLHSVNSFQNMNLSLSLLKGICSLGFYKPSMIQEKTLPLLVSTSPPNMIAQAQSGTGKTATFLMAMLSRANSNEPYCQCLCMVPTLELAIQLADVGRRMAKYIKGITFGTATRDPQVSTDEEGFVTDQIVIGTPGTIANWLRCLGPIRLDASFLKTFVLDEADVMILEEGFFNISLRIKKRLPSTCQILLFSATFEDEIMEFAREFVPDPIEIRVKRTQLPLKNIRQFHLRFNDWTEKYQALTDIYGGFDVGQAIIFCATRKEASWLEGRLNGDGHRVAILSGELDVKDREAVIEKFRSAQYRVLITTNVCARGLDIPQVNLIINWNMPLTCSGSADCETYLHRIGRSGRFGKNGVAVNFITDEELDVLHELEDYFDIKISPLTTEDLLDV
ncbi:hypothetical protein AHF37_01962 [Paragonimus kellicotti]|nr:hypothetical protein AHF37_01962 [Paragonimus kellicotti]